MTAKFKRDIYSFTLAGTALCGCLSAAPASAQSQLAMADAEGASKAASDSDTDSLPVPSGASSAGGLNEITVTAQKRVTRLQDTPISISVFSSEDLSNRHVISLGSLSDGSIPSLRIAPMFTRSSALTVGIRGIGTLGDANQPSRDQGVGVYIDGVYQGRAPGLGSALYDVERIEVLKGPQGTLFGRNTEGGAISIVTKKPSGELHLRASAGVSSYGGREASAHLDLPAIGNISVKLDGIITKRGGTVDNPLASEHDFNAYNKRGMHAAVLWEPSDSFNALYSFDTSRDDTTPFYVQLMTGGLYPRAPLIELQPDRASRANIGAPQAWNEGKTHGHLLTLDWNVAPEIELKSISSYRKLEQTQLDNGSSNLSVFVPNAAFSRYSLANVWQDQFSQEFQVIGDLPEVKFVAGGFYYDEQVNDDAWTPNTNQWNADGTAYTILPDPIAGSPFPDRATTAETESLGVFGQAVWTPAFLNEKVHLTVGGRYTHDKKTGSLDKVNGVSTDYVLDKSWDHFDPLINLAVDVAPDVNIYGKWSTGYKAGGANSRSLIFRSFGPETVSSFEIGAKAEFFDRHARLNIAAFTADYKNVQIDFNAPISNTNRTTIETVNAPGSGRSKGVEVDLALMPVEGLTLTVSYAYTDIHLPRAPNPFVTGNPLVEVYSVYTPDHAASGAIDYETAAGDARLSFHLSANYSAPQYTFANEATKTGKAFVVNGRIALGDLRMPSTDAALELAVWTRNLFNTDYAFVKSNSAALGTFGVFNEPRTVGVEATVKF
jgi:iron complex outermembrane receptor protein